MTEVIGNNDGPEGRNESYKIRSRKKVRRTVAVNEFEQGKHLDAQIVKINRRKSEAVTHYCYGESHMNYTFQITFLFMLLIFTADAQANTCGNQALDNRPNHCMVNGQHRISSCTVVKPGECKYTHCSGATTTVNDPRCCCTTWPGCGGGANHTKPGYVALCLGVTYAPDPGLVPGEDTENPGGMPPPQIQVEIPQATSMSLHVMLMTGGAFILGLFIAMLILRRKSDEPTL